MSIKSLSKRVCSVKRRRNFFPISQNNRSNEDFYVRNFTRGQVCLLISRQGKIFFFEETRGVPSPSLPSWLVSFSVPSSRIVAHKSFRCPLVSRSHVQHAPRCLCLRPSSRIFQPNCNQSKFLRMYEGKRTLKWRWIFPRGAQTRNEISKLFREKFFRSNLFSKRRSWFFHSGLWTIYRSTGAIEIAYNALVRLLMHYVTFEQDHGCVFVFMNTGGDRIDREPIAGITPRALIPRLDRLDKIPRHREGRYNKKKKR